MNVSVLECRTRLTADVVRAAVANLHHQADAPEVLDRKDALPGQDGEESGGEVVDAED